MGRGDDDENDEEEDEDGTSLLQRELSALMETVRQMGPRGNRANKQEGDGEFCWAKFALWDHIF